MFNYILFPSPLISFEIFAGLGSMGGCQRGLPVARYRCVGAWIARQGPPG